MIKAITITNDSNESIRLDLTDPWSSGFVVKSIDGLGPVKANVFFTELVTADGADDNSARLGTRNIVLSLLFLENPTIEETRLKTYKYFPIKRNVTFKVETENRICETVGRVETNSPNIFSEEEGCQISILCPDSYFHSVDTKTGGVTTFFGSEPLFEFPFENESLDENLIELGGIQNQPQKNVKYEGDAPIGVTIRIHAIGEASGISIYDLRTREIIQINDDGLSAIMGSGIQAGDDIIISTVKRKKGVEMIRGGVRKNLLNALEKPLRWPELMKGDNIFVFTVEDGLTNIQMSIENEILYEGA